MQRCCAADAQHLQMFLQQSQLTLEIIKKNHFFETGGAGLGEAVLNFLAQGRDT